MMNRRDFISDLSKFSIVGASVSMAGTAAYKSRQVAENSLNQVAVQFKSIKSRMDKLEHNQKATTRGLIVVAALSTGIDLSLIL